MTTHNADDAVQSAKPTIETVEQAAAEVARLYAIFDAAAGDLTDQYIRQQFAEKRGENATVFTMVSVGDVMRREGAILLGSVYGPWHRLLSTFRLSKSKALTPAKGGSYVMADAIVVRCYGRGESPGDEYIVLPNQVLKAERQRFDSVPTIDAYGKLGWSETRFGTSNTFRPLTDVSQLQQLVRQLQAYLAV